MQDFFCETLELDFRVAPEKFDKEAFLADVQSLDERGVHAYSYGSISKPEKQHSHIVVDLHSSERYRFRITYHAYSGDTQDTRPPYMEDCAQWLGRFFRDGEVQATLRAFYLFDEKFSPVVPLPFPLVATSKHLAGSKVTGLSLQLPREMGIQRAIVQRERDKDETSIEIETRVKLKLHEFDLRSQLESLALAVMALVNPVAQETDAQ